MLVVNINKNPVIMANVGSPITVILSHTPVDTNRGRRETGTVAQVRLRIRPNRLVD
jgi:hypothetical protein